MVTPPGGPIQGAPGGVLPTLGHGTVCGRVTVRCATVPSMARLVSVRRDAYTGRWLVSCLVCGRLADLRNFWPAAHMAKLHETIHEGEG
jgi:hypothetical protein